jgi:hypothetical protein
MALVKLEWHRRSVSDKLLKTEFIIQQMTTNAATFATPNPALADVEAAKGDLAAAAVNAQAGGVALTLAKNEAEDALDDLIKQLASYVQNISGGDESIILEAGMDVRKLPSPLPPPPQVENLDAYPTRTQGEVQLNWDPLGRSYFYQIEMYLEEDAGGSWSKLAVSSKSKFLVTGLTTGAVYQFRVAGIGRNDEMGPYSQDASSVAP